MKINATYINKLFDVSQVTFAPAEEVCTLDLTDCKEEILLLVDTSDCELTFDALSALLKEKGKEKNLSVQIQREDIFNSMHKI